MIVPLVLLVVTAYLVYWYVTGKDTTIERFPPGPRGLPILGHLLFLGNNPYETLVKIGHKYGSDVCSVYLGTDRVVILNSTSAICEASKKLEFSGRPDLEFMNVWCKLGTDERHGITLNQGPDWVDQRRFALRNLCNLGFGTRSMEDLVLLEVHDFVDIMLMLVPKVNQPMKIGPHFGPVVINSLWTLVAGTRFAYDDPQFSQLCCNITTNFTAINSVGLAVFFPNLAKIFPNLLGWKKVVEAIEGVRELAKSEVKKHKDTFKPDDPPRDFIDIYLKKMQSTMDPNSSFYKEKGERNLIVAMMDLFGAAVETTTTVLNWACLYLAYFPEVQKKIRKEMDRVVGSRSPTMADKPNMPYLDAVIHEVLRITAVIPLMLQHRVTEDTGTSVILNAYNAMKNPIDWQDPSEFQPEHFLDSDGNFRSSDAFMVFGSGKRACLGENLARMSLFLLLANIQHRFRLEFPDVTPKPSLDYIKPGVVLHPQPYDVVLRTREH